MAVTLFDLDNTLLAGDSDYLWGEYLCKHGIVDRDQYALSNDNFYRQYQNGEMDIGAFLEFALRPLHQLPLAQLLALRKEFLDATLDRLIAPGSLALIQQHRNNGDTLAIVTATNRFITAPIARELGIYHLIATEPTLGKNGFDGGYRNPPCFQEGKLTNINQWLTAYRLSQKGSYGYSDSHNDLPMLEWVDHPVAVDPDTKLKTIAREREWPVISLR